MNARIIGICRGNGLAYVAIQLADPSTLPTLSASAKNGSGTALPCTWHKLDEGYTTQRGAAVIIVVAPLLVSGSITITIRSNSDEASFALSSERIKWESRLSYRLKKRLAYAMRDIDGREDHERISLRYAYSVPDGGQLLVYVELSMPYHDDTQLRFKAFDESGNPTEVSAVAMNNLRKPLKPGSDIALRKQLYSLRFPRAPKGFTVVATDECHPKSRGFRSAASNQMERLRAEGEGLTLDANCDGGYDELFRLHRTTPGKALMQQSITFAHDILFSIVVPLYKTPVELFRAMINSVLGQSYQKWELILVDASPEDAALLEEVRGLAQQDGRVRYTVLNKNLGITENTNIGIAACTGDFVCFLDHDDMIEPDALFEYAQALEQHPDTDLLYSDEDKVSENGLHYYSPYFKSDFDIDLLRSHNYICHFLCVRKDVIGSFAPPTSIYDGAQDYNLTLRAAERARNVFHVRKILYHWRAIEGSTATDEANEGSVKSYATEAGMRAVTEHLERCGTQAIVEPGPVPFSHHVKYLVEGSPLVSIIIPNKDCSDLLEACIASILEKTTYPHYEIVIVENNSEKPQTEACYERLRQLDGRVRIARWSAEFNFSKIVNFGVREAKGDYLLLLNNDTEVINPEWLENMLGICQRSDVGAVGARLIYGDGTVQHAGVLVVDEFTPAHHAFAGLPDSNRGYFNLSVLTRQYSAVTAACLLTKRSVYEKVEGFNEKLTVAYNDVDYCFKVRELGLHIVYEPTAKLYHYESVSRGSDGDSAAKRIRAKKEIAYLFSHWSEMYMVGDPFFNPNLVSSHFQLKRD